MAVRSDMEWITIPSASPVTPMATLISPDVMRDDSKRNWPRVISVLISCFKKLTADSKNGLIKAALNM